MNDTVNFSGLTKEDFLRAEQRILSISGHGQVTVHFWETESNVTLSLYTFHAYTKSGEATYIHTIYIFDFTGNVEIKVAYDTQSGVTPAMHCDVALNAFPTTISQIEMLPKRIYAYNKAKDQFPSIDGFHKELIAALKAQSKEDFYDDTSDYQDDEPTDFGDVSNYDEALVQRIRSLLDS